jgi:hypothetical protein
MQACRASRASMGWQQTGIALLLLYIYIILYIYFIIYSYVNI